MAKLEEVARAMWEARRQHAAKMLLDLPPLEEWGDGSIPHSNGIMEEARAAVEAMRAALPFNIGDHVKIKPLESVAARVIEVSLAEDGWTIHVRYFQNGEPKTIKCFVDEVE